VSHANASIRTNEPNSIFEINTFWLFVGIFGAGSVESKVNKNWEQYEILIKHKSKMIKEFVQSSFFISLDVL
jgi:hypothetical protein